jgi:hypothetical protein
MEDIQALKQELLEKISGIDDYEILQVLKEDVEVYVSQQRTEGPYDFPGATEEEREEMIQIDKGEIDDKDDYVTEEEYQRLMNRWLTELPIRSVT